MPIVRDTDVHLSCGKAASPRPVLREFNAASVAQPSKAALNHRTLEPGEPAEQQQANLDLQRALDDVRKSEARLRTIIDAIPTQVWCALPDGSSDFQNQKWFDYTGLSHEAACGSGWQVALHPDDAARYMRDWSEIRRRGQAGESEVRLRRFDGEYRWFLIRREPVRDESGKIARWYCTNTDIEDRKRAEDELERAQAELTHVTRVATLGEMIASIAHEISQPLGALLLNAGVCLRWLTADNVEEARRCAALVIENGHRARDIVGRIRALVKRAPRREEWIDINQTIMDIVAVARNQMKSNQVLLEMRLTDDLPLIFGDRIQLQQVVLNLIINAIEAMTGVGRGSRVLLVRSGNHTPGSVLVAVADTGPGLDLRGVERLFDAFYTTKANGLGMGLAISRSIINAHGGRLWATRSETRGAVFQFTLPVGSERGS